MKILEILLGESDNFILDKDPGMFLYSLARKHNWQAVFAYFSNDKIEDESYQKYVDLVKLGDNLVEKEQVKRAGEYISKNAKHIDVLMLFHYGSAVYKLAKIAKKTNPRIKIYSKLDMNEAGFSHFYDGTLLRKIKSSIEIIKTRNVDFFTVENKYFYNRFEQLKVFRNKIGYLPNCVSLSNVDLDSLDNVEKENIAITVARLGDANKNVELIVHAIEKMPKDVIKKWKFYFVGSRTKEFDEYLMDKMSHNPLLKTVVVLTGAIYDRQKLYEMYGKSKIFLLTSKSESFGISTIEAMCFGCYPVITNYGTIVMDITDGGKYGDIVPQNSEDVFCKKLLERMQDEQLILKGKSCQEYVRKNFSYDHWAGKLDEYLKEV